MADESIKPSLKDVRGEKSDTGESLTRGLRTEPTVSRETVQKAEQETTKVRQELDSIKHRDEINGTNQPSSIAVKAKQRQTRFEKFRDDFDKKRNELIGPPKPVTWRTHVSDKLQPLLNFARIPRDIAQRIASLGKEYALPDRTVDVTVVSREAFLTDTSLTSLYGIEGNKKILRNFLEQEAKMEENCERILKITGLTVPEFQSLGRVLGYRPWAFLSGHRRENAGRVAIDNELPADGEHPFGLSRDDPDYAKDMALYGKVFPGVKHIPWVKDWRMSRTHGVVYAIKDKQGQDVILFPVHIDPKNPIVGVKDFIDKLQGKKPEPEEHGAFEYHGAAKEAGEPKVSTGLYYLGAYNYIRLLRQAAQHGKKIGRVVVHGEDILDTTGSIVKDDRVTWAIKGKS